LSLLQWLTLPFLALVLALAGLIGWLSWRAGAAAVDDSATLWLQGTVQRIGDDLQRRAALADSVLQVAFPEGLAAPADVTQDAEALRARFWAAATLHRQDAAHVYYGNRAGQYLALRRTSPQEAELRLKPAEEAPATRQRFRAAAGALLATEAAEAWPDPRQEAWYLAAQSVQPTAWTAVEVDDQTQGLIITRVRRILGSDARPAGVVATDLPLRGVDELLRQLPLSPRALAFVVERDGRLIAASHVPALRRRGDGSWERVSAVDPDQALMAATYSRLLPHLGGSSLAQPEVRQLDVGSGEPVVAGFARLADGTGQDWAVIVAAPRSNLTAGLLANAARTAAAALAAAAVVLILGALIKRRLTRDARELADVAERVGDGDLDTPPGAMGSVELDSLAESMRRMQLRLRTDRVTGLANREAVLTRLHDRMRPGRRKNDAPLVALLYVDLDGFRRINERHGHEAGDTILITLGRRLRQTVRDTDLVARWASDEFVLLLDGVVSFESAEQVRDQVERVLRDPVDLGPNRDAAELGGTVGMALYPGDAEDPDELMRSAEADMMKRKPASVSQW
jgi:diguanylate cyclase (GGDEF)-like protein